MQPGPKSSSRLLHGVGGKIEMDPIFTFQCLPSHPKHFQLLLITAPLPHCPAECQQVEKVFRSVGSYLFGLGQSAVPGWDWAECRGRFSPRPRFSTQRPPPQAQAYPTHPPLPKVRFWPKVVTALNFTNVFQWSLNTEYSIESI